jgi:hypothetical protein
MDNKEMLYEISLKYNTLKMYDNTIEQMKKNGSESSVEAIEKERDEVEKELIELLNPKNSCNAKTGIKNPSIDSGNEFLKKVQENYEKRKEEDKYYFDEESEDEYEIGLDEYPYEESNKPRLSDVQDKMSNSAWINSSNFIVRFPKKEINIDEWRVVSFSYSLNNPAYKKCSCNNYYEEEEKDDSIGGGFFVRVNDFSEKIDDANYNILSNIVLDLYRNPKIDKDIYVDIIDNNGDLLYTIVFEKCVFTGINGGGVTFDYRHSELSSMELVFNFKNIVILAPNEDLIGK